MLDEEAVRKVVELQDYQAIKARLASITDVTDIDGLVEQWTDPQVLAVAATLATETKEESGVFVMGFLAALAVADLKAAARLP